MFKSSAKFLYILSLAFLDPATLSAGSPASKNVIPTQSDQNRNIEKLQFSDVYLTPPASKNIDLAQAINALAAKSKDYIKPRINTSSIPDWLKRIDLQWSLQDNFKPSVSLSTVQPLLESKDLSSTLFFQGNYERYTLFGEQRDVINTGIGYRHLMLDNKVLIGANTFYDYEFLFNHQRWSSGLELKIAGVDMGFNKYWPISATHTNDEGVEEEPLEGHDIEASIQIPYLPWARVRGMRYYWESVQAAENIKGWSASLEMDIHENLRIEGGIKSDNHMPDTDEEESFFKVSLHFPFGGPVATSKNFINSQPWYDRDMRNYRLEKVRRENKIIVERRAKGVIIARGT